MTPQQTTFVLIAGAWHPASSFDLLAKRLRDAGYVVVSKTLPSVGAEPPLSDHQPDSEFARKMIEEEADKGQDVIVLMHSYGGLVGTEACKGLDKPSRTASGKKGGVVKLIYCAAFMLTEEASTGMVLPPPEKEWVAISEDMTRADIIPGTHHEILYNDLTPAQTEEAISTLKHHSAGAFFSNLAYASWKDIPSMYIQCTLDQAIKIEVQTAMVEAARKAGATVETATLEASHSPFLSMPDQVAAACFKAAEGTA